MVSPQKKRPPISPAWISPGLVTGGARSRNHKKTRRWCDTLPAHLLDRLQMYAEPNVAKRFVRVAANQFADNPFTLLVLICSGQQLCRDVLYAMQGIQKPIRLVFHTGYSSSEPSETRLGFLSAFELSLVERDRSKCAKGARHRCAISIAPTLPIRARAVLRSIDAGGTEIHAGRGTACADL